MDKDLSTLQIMFTLLQRSKPDAAHIIFYNILFTTIICAAAITGHYWLVILILISNIISTFGMSVYLYSMCDPDKFEIFCNIRERSNAELENVYGQLKIPTYILIVRVLLRAIEAYIIIMGGMVVLGSLWILIYTLKYNILYNANTKMKLLWQDNDIKI